jgi:hypothetical protein
MVSHFTNSTALGGEPDADMMTASKKSPNIQDEMMAELDRRERWDRVYERNQLYLSDEEKKKDLEQEMQKRLEWDTNHKLRLNVAPAK